MPYLLRFSLLLLVFCYNPLGLDPCVGSRAVGWCLLLVLALYFSRKSASITFTPLLLVLAAFAGLSGVGLLQSVNLAEGLLLGVGVFSLVTTVILVSGTLTKGKARVIDVVQSLVVGVLCVQVVGMVQLVDVLTKPDPTSYEVVHIRSLLANKNIFAGFLAVTFPVVVYAALHLSKKGRLLGVFAAGLSVLFIGVLQSRAALLAAGVVILIMLINGAMRRKELQRKALMVVGVSGVLASLLVVALFTFNPSLGAYSTQKAGIASGAPEMATAEEGSLERRLAMWEYSAEMIVDRPVLGHGLASWKFVLPQYGYASTQGKQGIRYSQRPHNDLLWVAAELGIPGALLYLLLFALALVMVVRLHKTPSGGVAGYLGAALVAFGVISMVGFPRERPVQQFVFALILGTLVHLSIKEKTTRTWALSTAPVKLLWTTALLLACFGSWFALDRMLGEVHTQKLLASSEKSNGAVLAARAERWSYTVDATSTPLAWYQGVAHFAGSDFERAEKSFQRALNYHPHHIQIWNNLGSSRFNTGDLKGAEKAYRKALFYSPTFSEALCNLAALQYNQGKKEEAYATFNQVGIDKYRPATYPMYAQAIVGAQLKRWGGQKGCDQRKVAWYLQNPDSLVLHHELDQQGIQPLRDRLFDQER